MVCVYVVRAELPDLGDVVQWLVSEGYTEVFVQNPETGERIPWEVFKARLRPQTDAAVA
jgi:hypothetical protein